MQLTIDIPDRDIADFGRQAIEKELANSIKWLRLRNRFTQLAQGLWETHKEADYQRNLQEIRADAWETYKKDLGL
jgi:hypothetical protein